MAQFTKNPSFPGVFSFREISMRIVRGSDDTRSDTIRNLLSRAALGK
jgi:hypothetical protein